jgi:hypothetical protein
VIVDAFAADQRLVLEHLPSRLSVGEGVGVEVDARCEDPPVFVEAYARQGRLKGAQLKKMAQDILKLALLRRQSAHADARAVVVFASAEAERSVTGWLRQAAATFDVELCVVDIPKEDRQQILAARERQKMTNIELPASELAGDLAATAVDHDEAVARS